MAINKDAALASGILLGCVLILGYAFTGPGDDGVDEDGPVIADGGSPDAPSMPGLTPDTPEGGEGVLRPADGRVEDAAQPDNETTIPIDQPELPAGDGERPIDDGSGIVIADAGGEVGRGDNAFERISSRDPLDDYDPLARIREAAQVDERPERPERPERSADDERPTSQPAGEGRSYTVVGGDSLGEISLKVYGSSRHWRRLQQANDIADPTALHVGQVLSIPDIDGAAPSADQPQRSARQLGDGQRRYTVGKGDSYYIIAQRELGDASRWREVQELNDIDPYDLMPGQDILLPAGRRTPLTPSRRTADDSVPAGARIHVVSKGEVLGFISQRYYGTARRWREIARANNIVDPVLMRAGTRLVIPRLSDSPFESGDGASSRRAAPSSAASGRYTVRSGDRLVDIARRVYGDPDQYRRILDANPGLNPRRLKVGQVLTVPGFEGGSAPSGDGGTGESGDGGQTTRLQDLIRQAEGG